MKWYEKGWVIFLLLLFVFPVGVFLLWKYGHWRKPVKVIATVIFAFIFLMAIIPTPKEVNVDISTEANTPVENISQPKENEPEEVSESVEVSEPKSTLEPIQISELETEPVENLESEPKPEVEHRTGDDFVGISDKNINNIDVKFMGNVNNDVTGNWRYATISVSEDIDTIEYALSYYREYFKSDSEIHYVINFTKNTTTCINTFDGYKLDISVYEHINGEERNAKQIPSGTLLEKYSIYTDNGDIEKLQ